VDILEVFLNIPSENPSIFVTYPRVFHRFSTDFAMPRRYVDIFYKRHKVPWEEGLGSKEDAKKKDRWQVIHISTAPTTTNFISSKNIY
jgi:hypothetical protein